MKRLLVLFTLYLTSTASLKPTRKPHHGHHQRTQSPAAPVILDPALLEQARRAVKPNEAFMEAAVEATGRTSASVGAAATEVAAEAVMALSGNLTADEAVKIAVEGVETAVKTVVGASVALNMLAGLAKSCAMVATVAMVGPSVKIIAAGAAIAASNENETEALFQQIGDSYQQHFERNLAESARKRWLTRADEATASNAEAWRRAAATTQAEATAAKVAELRAWLDDVRVATAALERSPLDRKLVQAAQHSAMRLTQLAAVGTPLVCDELLAREIDEALSIERSMQDAAAQLLAECRARRAERREMVAARRAEAEAVAAADAMSHAVAAAAVKAAARRFRPLRILRRLPLPPRQLSTAACAKDLAEDMVEKQRSMWRSQDATPLAVPRARWCRALLASSL